MSESYIKAFDQLNDDYNTTLTTSTGTSYSNLSDTLNSFQEGLREYIQNTTKDKILAVVTKLKNGEPVSSEDLKLVRLWVVGDADYYTTLENNFGDWLAELKRLIDEINKLKTPEPDIEAASKLQGLIRDGLRVLADIFYFLQQKERIEKFDSSTKELDSEERTLLVRILEQKVSSPDF